ncbi:MAG: hypothetical protein JWQ57_1745, partial [Mucilaginibacter sp.]|nr:hypothetical protein [Mucilaginibacter sp.]
GGVRRKMFYRETTFFMQAQAFDIAFKQVVFNIHPLYYRAEMLHIQVVKINTRYHGIPQAVFIPEMEVIDGDGAEIQRPWFAWRCFGGITGVKIIYNKLQVGSTVFLFFEVEGTIIQFNIGKVDSALFNTAEKMKILNINSQVRRT